MHPDPAAARPWRGLAAFALLGLGVLVPQSIGGDRPGQVRALPLAEEAQASRDAIDCRSRPDFAQGVFLEPEPGAAAVLPAIVRVPAPPPSEGVLGPDPVPVQVLASQERVGSVYGLAWDAVRERLYAAAYLKRGLGFGPNGPGAVYRVDPRGGGVDLIANLDVGPDRHAPPGQDDAATLAWVGRSGLGGIEVDPLGRWLFAVDLGRRAIRRVELGTGIEAASLELGGEAEPDFMLARPFGLTWHAGWLYHGWISADGPSASLDLRLFRTREDGSQLQDLGRLSLDSGRGQPWTAWEDRPSRISGAQPMLVDLEILGQGASADGVVFGLRDRVADLSPSPGAPLSQHTGDLLLAEFGPDGRLRPSAEPSRFDDAGFIPEAAWGSLATWPALDQLVAPLYLDRHQGAVAWFDLASGRRLATRPAYRIDPDGENRVHGLGDIEGLCGPAEPDPALAATATAALAAPTATAAAGLEVRRGAACRSGAALYAASRFAPGFRPDLADSPALLALTEGAAPDSEPQPLASQAQLGTVHGLAWDESGKRLFAAAFNKAATRFGPGGPGAVYRLDLARGRLSTLTRLSAGPDRHRFDPSDYYNDPARDWVGLSGLGDLEWLEGTLYAMNLAARRIERIDPDSGALLPPIPMGAASESWAAEARPFALAAWRGQLFQGLVRSQPGAAGEPIEARVYRSEPDGSAMRQVLALDLTTPRPSGARAWTTWEPGGDPGPQPWLTDIAFRPDGTMLLAFKDRRVDARVSLSSPGELYAARQVDPDGWIVDVDAPRPELPPPALPWGALAAVPGRPDGPPGPAASAPDRFAMTVLALDGANRASLAWLAGDGSGLSSAATVYAVDPLGEGHDRVKVAGLGDVEALCDPAPAPSPSPRPSVTPVAFPSPPSSGATPPAPPSIYLPLGLSGACPAAPPLDLVLVLDLSSSMRLAARDGRPKIDVALEAARGFLVSQRLGAGGDRIALVGFNARAWTQTPLSADWAAVDLALSGMSGRIAEGTRLDLALAEGGDALLASRPGSRPALLLLTDGLPNGVPTPAPTGSQAEALIRDASRLRRRGVRILTLALGRPDDPNPSARVDLALLSAIASRPADALHAEDAVDLARQLERGRLRLDCWR